MEKIVKIKIKEWEKNKINKKIEKYKLKKSVNHKTKESVIYKQPRKSYTKSQWAWEWEKDYERMKNKYGEKDKKMTIKNKQAVILYDGENYDAYEAEIEKTNDKIILKIPCGRGKLKVKVRREKIEDEEIIKIALLNKAEIYRLEEIIEK